jgi:hypothetical protein
MKNILFAMFLPLIIGCKKNGEEKLSSVSATNDLNPVGIWDVTYFKHRSYSVGARFEAPKGLTMTFFSDNTFTTHNIPHIITPQNLQGKYKLNKVEKTITITETQSVTQPTMFVDNDILGKAIGRLIFLDGTAFVAEYELRKRN